MTVIERIEAIIKASREYAVQVGGLMVDAGDLAYDIVDAIQKDGWEIVRANDHRGAVDLCRRLLAAIPHDHSEAMPGNPSGRCARCRFASEFDALGGQ